MMKYSNAKKIYTSEPYYDLFEGGYINPDALLEMSDAEKVNEAVMTIMEFFAFLESEDLIEYT